jgi:predicted outer membrane repeat protein
VQHAQGKGDGIRHALTASILVLLLIAAANGGSRMGGQERYVPGEVIVKFRGSPTARTDAGDFNEAEIVSRLLSIGKAAMVRPLIERDRRPHSVGQDEKRGEESQLRKLIRQKRQSQTGRAASDFSRVYRVVLSGQDQNGLDAVLWAYRQMPEVEYAELNPVISACATTPNDSLFASQWALSKIQASAAWDVCVGTVSPVVAVIDSGVDLHHRDLQSNLWVNEAELRGAAGVDDDENGYVDDVNGYNFVYRTNNTQDDFGHGTHVAGIIAAAGNNGTDIAGVCWHVRIMPVKILDSEGNGDTATAATAICYAVDNGADVINASWGGADTSQALADAIAYAEQQGVIVVAAAGNDGTQTPFYPAYYSTVIAVAATDKADRRLISSNYGNWVDITAPGYSILSLRAAGTSQGTPLDAYTTSLSGTSMASPHVAGTCALLLAVNPFLTCDQIRQIITTSGDPISTGIVSSNRRLNAAGALNQVVSRKGVIYFDRSAYSRDSDIGVLLVDSDLAGKTAQTVTIQTSGGDVEAVVLSQATWAKGVFTGKIHGRDAEPTPADGVLEIRDGEQVMARYTDADDGIGHTGSKVTAVALADYQAASVTNLETGIRSSAVRLLITTSEAAKVEVHYHRSGNATTTRVVHSNEPNNRHEILISPLPRKTDYGFVIHMTDAAGNESTDDNGGHEYTFSTAADSPDLRVPSVYPTLQAAVDAAWSGDTIWIADGNYHGDGNRDIDFKGKALTLCSENGPAACIIDCNSVTGAFYFHSGEDARNVVDGFTITHGANVDTGGGIFCEASSPTIRNCIFLTNKVASYGAGICNEYGSSPAISHCTFKNNSASAAGTRGGAVANRFGSDPVISDCTFIGNTAGESGGAITNTDDSRPQIIRCVFQGNTANSQGGAIASLSRSAPTLSQCIFSANSSQSSGGAIYCEAGTNTHLDHCLFSANTAWLGGAIANDGAAVTLTNCTLGSNKSWWSCGGLWNGAGSMARVEDCILWGNTDSNSPQQIDRAQVVRDNVDLIVDYSCVQGTLSGLPGVGNIASDPLFGDPNNGDYHLMSGAGRWNANQKLWVIDTVTSPCIDAGDPSLPLGDEPLSTPLDPTNTWSINRRIDMGVYGGTSEASMALRN